MRRGSQSNQRTEEPELTSEKHIHWWEQRLGRDGIHWHCPECNATADVLNPDEEERLRNKIAKYKWQRDLVLEQWENAEGPGAMALESVEGWWETHLKEEVE